MQDINQYTKFCMNYSIVHAGIVKKLDAQLSFHGISFSEFMILFHLDHAIEKKMRRIDLAEKVSMSASGITRIIAPMEKIGLVHKESNKRDARVSLVKLSTAGERILREASTSLNLVSRQILSNLNKMNMDKLITALKLIGGTID